MNLSPENGRIAFGLLLRWQRSYGGLGTYDRLAPSTVDFLDDYIPTHQDIRSALLEKHPTQPEEVENAIRDIEAVLTGGSRRGSAEWQEGLSAELIHLVEKWNTRYDREIQNQRRFDIFYPSRRMEDFIEFTKLETDISLSRNLLHRLETGEGSRGQISPAALQGVFDTKFMILWGKLVDPTTQFAVFQYGQIPPELEYLSEEFVYQALKAEPRVADSFLRALPRQLLAS